MLEKLHKFMVRFGVVPDYEEEEKEMIISERLDEEAKLYAEERKLQRNRERLYDTTRFFDIIHQRKRDRDIRPIKGTGTYKDLSFKKLNEKTKKTA